MSSKGIEYNNQYVNGREFVVGTIGELQIWTHLMTGKDIQVLIYVVNGTDRSITFDPSRVVVERINAGKKKYKLTLRTFTASEYEKKARHKNAWINGLNAFSAGLANQPSPRTSTVSGDYDSYDSSGRYSSGTFSGRITTWPSSADYAAANARTQAQIQSTQTYLNQSYAAMSATLLRKHTLTPKTYVGGIVHVVKKKAPLYHVSVPFDGNDFRFRFTGGK